MTGNLSEKSAERLLMKRVSNAYKLKYLSLLLLVVPVGHFWGQQWSAE